MQPIDVTASAHLLSDVRGHDDGGDDDIRDDHRGGDAAQDAVLTRDSLSNENVLRDAFASVRAHERLPLDRDDVARCRVAQSELFGQPTDVPRELVGSRVAELLHRRSVGEGAPVP